jgi:hypothetical protein
MRLRGTAWTGGVGVVRAGREFAPAPFFPLFGPGIGSEPGPFALADDSWRSTPEVRLEDGEAPRNGAKTGLKTPRDGEKAINQCLSKTASPPQHDYYEITELISVSLTSDSGRRPLWTRAKNYRSALPDG